jgi:PAS domain S-box-containing protein
MINYIDKSKEELIEEIEKLKKENESLSQNNISEKNNSTFEQKLITSINALSKGEDIAKFGHWLLNVETKEVIFSAGANKLYGIDKTENSLEFLLSIVLPEYREFLNEKLSNLINKNGEYNIEYKIKRLNDGKIVDINLIAEYDAKNNIVFGSIQDITEQKVIENTLIENKKQLIEVLENSIDANYHRDLKSLKYKYLSPVFEKLTGYSIDDFIEFTLEKALSLMHPDDIEVVNKTIDLALNDSPEVPYQIEYRFLNLNGNYIWLQDQFKVIFNSDGMPISIIGSISDITKRKRTEESLSKNESLLQLIIDKSADVIWIMNTNTNKFTFVSPSVEKLRGFTPEEVMQRPVNESVTPESSIIITKYLNEYLPKFLLGDYTSNIGITEIDQPCKDGSIVHTEVTTSLMLNDNGEIEILGISRDITERKKNELKLRNSEEKYRSMFENIHDVYYEVDLNGKIIEISPSIFSVSKGSFKRDDLIGIDLQNVYKNREDREKFLGQIRKFGFVNDYELELLNKDNIPTHTSVTAKIQFDINNNPVKVVGVLRDVTERTIAKIEQNNLLEQLKESNKIIESNLNQKNELIAQLTEAKSNLEVINSEKDKFFSIIAHDLKSPFSGFLGITKFMAEQIQELTFGEMKEYSKIIQKSALNLYKLLENLLEWSLIKRGMMEFNPLNYDLQEIIKENVDVIYANAKQKNIQVINIIPNDISIYADHHMLNTVIRNLLNNAIKFTHEGGFIDIGIQRPKINFDNSVCVFIKDSGIGMDDDIKLNLFKLNANVSRTGTNDEPSSGLGLLLCKEFINKHNGEIWVESEEGIGSTFYFRLPNN